MSQLPPSRQLRFDQVIAAWFVAFTLLLEGAVMPIAAEQKALLPSLPIADVPILEKRTPETATPSGVTASRFIAIDLESGSVLVESKSTEPQAPASVLKLLTALTALDFYKLTDVITLTEVDVARNSDSLNELKWQAGEVVLVQDLLASVVMKSDNHAAEALATHAPGGRAAFLAAMQIKAQQYHLNASFKVINASGLDEVDQQLSAQDLTWLGEAAYANPNLKMLMAEKTQSITGKVGGTIGVPHLLINTNQLLWSELPILAGKTGTTEAAGEVLLSIFQIQNHPVMIVVMGSADRYADTRAIFDWIQTHYHWQSWAEFAYNR